MILLWQAAFATLESGAGGLKDDNLQGADVFGFGPGFRKWYTMVSSTATARVQDFGARKVYTKPEPSSPTVSCEPAPVSSSCPAAELL